MAGLWEGDPDVLFCVETTVDLGLMNEDIAESVVEVAVGWDRM